MTTSANRRVKAEYRAYSRAAAKLAFFVGLEPTYFFKAIMVEAGHDTTAVERLVAGVAYRAYREKAITRADARLLGAKV